MLRKPKPQSRKADFSLHYTEGSCELSLQAEKLHICGVGGCCTLLPFRKLVKYLGFFCIQLFLLNRIVFFLFCGFSDLSHQSLMSRISMVKHHSTFTMFLPTWQTMQRAHRIHQGKQLSLHWPGLQGNLLPQEERL